MENSEISQQIAAQGDQWVVQGCACQDPETGRIWRLQTAYGGSGGRAFWIAATITAPAWLWEDSNRTGNQSDWASLDRARAAGPLSADAAPIGALRMVLPPQWRPSVCTSLAERPLSWWAHVADSVASHRQSHADEITAILHAFFAWQKAGCPQ